MNKMVMTLVLVHAFGSLVACGGGDDPPPNGGDTDRFTGSISGTVSYTGAITGPLIISVGFVEVPTCPTDVPVDFTLIQTPSFPQAYSFSGLPAGNYHLFGFLNNGGHTGTCPIAGDICGRSTPATPLDPAHPTATIDVTLDIPDCTL